MVTCDGQRRPDDQREFFQRDGVWWQQAMFAARWRLQLAPTTWCRTTPQGHYSVTRDYFTTARLRASLLTAPAGNGGYKYGAGAFPTEAFSNTRCWVDLIFTDAKAPSVVGQEPAANATAVAESAVVRATFDEAVVPASVVVGSGRPAGRWCRESSHTTLPRRGPRSRRRTCWRRTGCTARCREAATNRATPWRRP